MSRQMMERSGDLFVGINEAAEPNNLSDLEKKHIPFIDAPETVTKGEYFDIRVEVGRLLAHQNEYQHFIQFLDLYADDAFLTRVDFMAGRSCPKATFCVSLHHPAKELRAYAHCNLHGTWLGRKAVSVTE